jgi:hypothetical protein
MRHAQAFRIVAIAGLFGLAGCEHMGVFEPFREVSCFQAAKVSLKDAIDAAEGQDARALDADYRQDEEMGCLNGIPGAYDVTLLSGNRIYTVSVDAGTRVQGPRLPSGAMNALLGGGPHIEGSSADMARMLPTLQVRMSQAIDTAEEDGGKVMAAWIEAHNGKPGYTVKLVRQGRVRVGWIAGG